MVPLVRAFALAAALTAAGCGATRPLEDVSVRSQVPTAAIRMFDEHGRALAGPPNVRALGAGDYHILALSGGGSSGAFGAGLLKGWSESGKRPDFDVVTGVSTGALMATFAFLGPRYDEELRALYTEVHNADLYRSKGLAGLLGDSLLDYEPLKKKISEVITGDVLDRVAAEHRRGRRLYVASTNLDAGRLVVWDMGYIAASGHSDRAAIYEKVLRASAAIPAVFKPVYIQPTADTRARQMHVDGGVKAPVLVRGFMYPRDGKRARVWVVVNSRLRFLDADEAVEPSLLSISKKSVSELLRTLMDKTVKERYEEARRAGARFYLAAIPDDGPEIKNAVDFEPEQMRALYEFGRGMGRAGRWSDRPPRLERFE